MTNQTTTLTAPAESHPFEAWKRLQRELMDQEKALADVAMRHALGEATAGQLDDVRRHVEQLRDLVQTAFETVLSELQPEDRI